MAFVRNGSALLLGVGLVGCHTYKTDVKSICDSPAHVDPGTPQDERATAAAAWVVPKLRDPEARGLFASLALMPPADRAAHLREEAARAGFAECALAEIWEAPPRPDPYRRDIATLCEASLHMGSSADPAAQATAAAEWITAHVSDPRAIAFFGSLANMDPEQRITAFRDEAVLAGVAACPYADWMESRLP